MTGPFAHVTAAPANAARRLRKARAAARRQCNSCHGRLSLNSRSGLCRRCYLDTKKRACVDCGGPISNATRARCKACYLAGAQAPVPEDFAELAAKLCKADLILHYHRGDDTIARWFRETGLTPVRVFKPRRAPPADLAEHASRMCLKELAGHYKTHTDVVHRWLRETGVKAMAYARKPKPKPVRRQCTYSGPQAPRIPPRDTSLEGEAAHYLRRQTFVFRCGPNGSADQRGDFWRYGNVVLTPDEMIARAKRHGFNPDAWQYVDRGSPADARQPHLVSHPCDEAFFDCAKSFGDHARAGA